MGRGIFADGGKGGVEAEVGAAEEGREFADQIENGDLLDTRGVRV